MKTSGIITLLTDFGLSDSYVAVMKGVILSINPRARLVDISHEVRPGSIPAASELLLDAFPFFPRGTVHMVVVDPGVGGLRRPIALQAENQLFVGPDNGLFWPVITRTRAVKLVHLTERKYFLEKVSHTFHGRDVFAPVSAHLSLGLDLSLFGTPLDDPVESSFPQAYFDGKRLLGKITRVDHFGNLITNLREEDLKRLFHPERMIIRIADLSLRGIRNTYSDVEKGEALAVIGSGGRLEIGVNLGRASDLLGKKVESIVGTEVEASEAPARERHDP